MFQILFTLLCYNERVINQLSVHQLAIQGLLIYQSRAYMARSIKRVLGTPRDSLVNSKLSP